MLLPSAHRQSLADVAYGSASSSITYLGPKMASTWVARSPNAKYLGPRDVVQVIGAPEALQPEGSRSRIKGLAP